MPRCRSRSLCHSVPSVGDINAEMDNLIKLSMSTNSWKTYKTVVDSFNFFRISYGFDDILPASVDHIARFIAYLSHKGLAASTVSTYISGLNHAHKINDLIDNTKSFIISKLLEGLRRRYPQRPDARTPISRDMLKCITVPFKQFALLFMKHVCFLPLSLLLSSQYNE